MLPHLLFQVGEDAVSDLVGKGKNEEEDGSTVEPRTKAGGGGGEFSRATQEKHVSRRGERAALGSKLD